MVDTTPELMPTVVLGPGDPAQSGSVTPRPSGDGADAVAGGARLGRYLVVGQAGAGGMGVVLRAYDPRLRREVALKRLRLGLRGTADSEGEARLLREARAMARLSHPNVIPVYDVEEIDGHVFVVMEYVEGVALHEWIREGGRDWRATLAMFVQCARGLAAAHAVGVVHRDFKPSNVLVSSDGRARVLDFGLARTATELDASTSDARRIVAGAHDVADDVRTAANVVLGTPAYMPPEQHDGVAPDARADQYAWCASLWEALFGARPYAGDLAGLYAAKRAGPPAAPPGSRVPRWLEAIVARGLAPDPARRFASLDALVVAVQHGQTRARLRTAGLLAGVVAVGGLGAVGARRLERARTAEACAREGAAIDAAWNDLERGRLREAMIATGAPSAAEIADRTLPWIDAQAVAWKQARADACLDTHVRELWDDDTLARANWCLDERRMELEALVAELASSDAYNVYRAIQSASSLSDTASCRDENQLRRLPLPPTEQLDALREVRVALFRMSARTQAGRVVEALEIGRDAATRAASIAWPPLEALAQADLGQALTEAGLYPEAVRTLEGAYFTAASAGATTIAADAADALVYAVGYQLAERAPGMLWARLAEVEYERLGIREATQGEADPPELAHHFESVAAVHFAAGDRDTAKRYYERTIAIEERTRGTDHPATAHQLNNLASVLQTTGEPQQARALHTRALAIYQAAYPAEHPDIAMSLSNLAGTYVESGEYAEALPLAVRALELRTRVLPPEHPEIGESELNVASILVDTGEFTAAIPHYRRALAIFDASLDGDHPRKILTMRALADALSETGSDAEGLGYYRRALDMATRFHGPDHPAVAQVMSLLAAELLSSGEIDEAEALQVRALAIFEKVHGGGDDLDLANPLIGLAQVEIERGRGAAALPLAERAVALCERFGVRDVEIAGFRFVLGQALMLGGDRSRGRALVDGALRVYRAMGAPERSIGEIETWLARHGG